MEQNSSKSWLLIENKGEIDINALILMGGSTKRDSTSAIGFYGSGLKYSIALMIRKEIPFRIYAGTKEHVITTREIEFRDKKFKQILVNGQDTSLTTDMGPEWEGWSAVRETVSNSIDEGESNVVSATELLSPKEGYTRIYIQHHPEIAEVIRMWDRYFSFDRTDDLINVAAGRLYPQTDMEKESLLLYRKGIQCYSMKTQRSMYHYDLPTFKINESRVLSDTWDARRDICGFLSTHATVEIATNILGNAFTGDHNYWEGNFEWKYYGARVLSQNWRLAIGDRIIVNNDASGFYMKEMAEHKYYRVSKDMARAIKETFTDVPVYGIGRDDNDSLNWRELEETPKQKYMLKRAQEFCQETGYNLNYEVKIVEFDKVDTLGCAHDKTIYIAGKTFDKGMKEVVMTLIEENEHINTGLKDETREWCNHFIQLFLTEKEERFGVFL